MNSAAFVFCTDLGKDPVARHVLDALKDEYELEAVEQEIDGYPVLRVVNSPNGVELSIIRTNEVISHDYNRYSKALNETCSTADLVGLVNWHEGANAPEKIFTVQSTGDMASGVFSSVNPRIFRSLLLAIEDERQNLGLEAFQTFAEATHWSGVQYGYDGSSVSDLRPAVVDVEIGSTKEDWTNPIAACVLARSLPRVFERVQDRVVSLLCMGGKHFEPAFTRAVFDRGTGPALAVSHILPNQWLVSEGYDRPERIGDLQSCAASIDGGIDAVVFHDKLKSAYKILARQLATEMQVPVFSHKKLKNTADLLT